MKTSVVLKDDLRKKAKKLAGETTLSAFEQLFGGLDGPTPLQGVTKEFVG